MSQYPWLRHPEDGGSRYGYARYDPNTGYFTCRTCGFELASSNLAEPCATPGCRGVVRVGQERLACDVDPSHLVAVEETQ